MKKTKVTKPLELLTNVQRDALVGGLVARVCDLETKVTLLVNRNLDERLRRLEHMPLRGIKITSDHHALRIKLNHAVEDAIAAVLMKEGALL
jgi:hypothetical protein